MHCKVALHKVDPSRKWIDHKSQIFITLNQMMAFKIFIEPHGWICGVIMHAHLHASSMIEGTRFKFCRVGENLNCLCMIVVDQAIGSRFCLGWCPKSNWISSQLLEFYAFTPKLTLRMILDATLQLFNADWGLLYPTSSYQTYHIQRSSPFVGILLLPIRGTYFLRFACTWLLDQLIWSSSWYFVTYPR